MKNADDRFFGHLDEVAQFRKPGIQRRLAELPDVGARDEGAALAIERDHLDIRAQLQGLDRLPETGAQRVGSGIDRRVVQGDEPGLAGNFDGNDVVDGNGTIKGADVMKVSRDRF